MVEYIVRPSKGTRIKIDQKELMRKSLLQIAQDRVKDVTEEQILFDGTYLVIEPQWVPVAIDEKDLIDNSVKQVLKKKFGIKGAVEVKPGKPRAKK